MKLWLLCLCVFLSVHCDGQVQVGGTSDLIPASMSVTITPSSIGVGGTAALTANHLMTDGSVGVVRTAQCHWTSASTGVATISPAVGYGSLPIVTGVSAGTSVITCVDGPFTGSATVTVIAPPLITNPTCGVPPCVLPGGSNGVVYPTFTFAQSGCLGTNTWTVTVGTINTGLSLSTAGVITGTPTVNGTQTFTVQDACSSPVTSATVQVSITVSTPSGGPPNFNGSSKSVSVITQPTQPTMAAVNSTGYAYSVPTDPYYPVGGHGNCYTALTDSSSQTGSAHSSWSGGGSNVMSDINRAYFALTDDAGAVRYFHAVYDGNGCMQRDSTTLTISPSGGTAAGFAFSRDTAATAYKIAPVGHNATGDPNTGTVLYQEALSGTTTVTVTRTKLFDFNNCPGVNGTFATQGGNGNLNVNYNSQRYSTSLNFPPAVSGQNGAHWVLVWDRPTNSCATYFTGVVPTVGENPANGNIWSFCTGNCSQHGTNPAPLAMNTTCDPGGYGVHDTGAYSIGLYVGISGKCAGPTTTNNSTLWTSGANVLRNCNQNLYQCGGHGTSGYAYGWSALSNFLHRPANDITTWTVIRPLFSPGIDQHGGDNWIGAAADTNPWLASAHPNIVSSSCAGLPYCNELVAIRLDGVVVRFGPSFHQWTGAGSDLGPIPAMTQDGYCILFESTWNKTRGTDSKGNFRKDLFSLCNLQ